MFRNSRLGVQPGKLSHFLLHSVSLGCHAVGRQHDFTPGENIPPSIHSQSIDSGIKWPLSVSWLRGKSLYSFSEHLLIEWLVRTCYSQRDQESPDSDSARAKIKPPVTTEPVESATITGPWPSETSGHGGSTDHGSHHPEWKISRAITAKTA